MYRLDYYDEKGNNVVIHGFKTPELAQNYIDNHPEKYFGLYPLILSDSEYYLFDNIRHIKVGKVT